jgi:hypothetical protein
MKSERRHELQQNWLADRVAAFAEDAKPYAKAVGGALLALLVLVGTYLYLNKRADAEKAGAWEKTWHALYSNDPKDRQFELRSIAENAPHSPAGLWAQLYLADQELTGGVNALFTEKSAGMTDIRSALDGYQAVQSAATDPFLQQRAWYGIGRAEESLDQLDKARAAYEQIVKNYPDGPYFPRAKRALDVLNRDQAKSFYDWFASVQPPTHTSGTGAGPNGMGSNGETSPFDSALPPLPPDFKLPDLGQSSKTPPPEPKPDEGPSLTPKSTPPAKTPDTKPPDSKTPDTKTPASKAPETKTPDVKAPDTKASDAKTPDAKAPDSKKPDSKTPDAPAPDASKTK